MTTFIDPRAHSEIIIIVLLVLTQVGLNDALATHCDCGINVLGPFHANRLVLVCHDHRYGLGDQQQLKYSWHFTNTSNDSRDAATYGKKDIYKISLYKVAKMKLERKIEGRYTCVVTRPGFDSPGNCSVHMKATPADGHHKMASVETIHDCQEMSPLQFEPSPTKGIVHFVKDRKVSLTCRSEAFPSSENNLTFAMELGPLTYPPEDANTPSSTTSTPSTSTNESHTTISDSHSSAPKLYSNEAPSSLDDDRKCKYRHERRSNDSITVVFPNFGFPCVTIYVCKGGYSQLPGYENSVLLLARKQAKLPALDPTSSGEVSSRIKRRSSFFQKHNDKRRGNGTNGSHEDDDDDDHHKEGGGTKVSVPPGVIYGVAVMMLLAAVAVAVAIVWKRRAVLRNRRFLSRRISSSKIPLFVNKSYTKSENSELEEFPRKNIRFLDHIGKGTFGTVVMAEVYNLHKQRKGIFADRWTTVAVKMTLISEKSNDQLKKDFLCELALMKTIPAHTNIITLHASCTAHDPYLMILEYAQHGDLRQYLLQHRTERNYANAAFCAYGVGSSRTGNLYFQSCNLYRAGETADKGQDNIPPKDKTYVNIPTSECTLIASRDLLSFALQICRGLEHLSENKIVHRDVAARNVLVFENRIVKISDFGLARKVGEEDVYERTTKGLLPVRWMSPESLFYNQFSEKSDVWSFGVLLWELITLGSTPYPGLDAANVLDKIRRRELLVCPPHSSAVVNEVVSSCWGEEPRSRPCFTKLVESLEKLLESEVEYLDLDQINDHEYSTLD